MEQLVLIGASGLAREVIAASQSDYEIVGILDDDAGAHGRRLSGISILGDIDSVVGHTEKLLLCVGSGQTRSRIADRLALSGIDSDRFAVLVDRSVRVPLTCSVGRGSILLANTVLTSDIVVGNHVVAMPNVTLTHDDVLEDFVTLAAGVSLGGSVRVGRAAYIGMNASVRERTHIGAGSTVGMGAAVLNNIPANQTWAGVPARALDPRKGVS